MKSIINHHSIGKTTEWFCKAPPHICTDFCHKGSYSNDCCIRTSNDFFLFASISMTSTTEVVVNISYCCYKFFLPFVHTKFINTQPFRLALIFFFTPALRWLKSWILSQLTCSSLLTCSIAEFFNSLINIFIPPRIVASSRSQNPAVQSTVIALTSLRGKLTPGNFK